MPIGRTLRLLSERARRTYSAIRGRISEKTTKFWAWAGSKEAKKKLEAYEKYRKDVNILVSSSIWSKEPETFEAELKRRAEIAKKLKKIVEESTDFHEREVARTLLDIVRKHPDTLFGRGNPFEDVLASLAHPQTLSKIGEHVKKFDEMEWTYLNPWPVADTARFFRRGPKSLREASELAKTAKQYGLGPIERMRLAWALLKNEDAAKAYYEVLKHAYPLQRVSVDIRNILADPKKAKRFVEVMWKLAEVAPPEKEEKIKAMQRIKRKDKILEGEMSFPLGNDEISRIAGIWVRDSPEVSDVVFKRLMRMWRRRRAKEGGIPKEPVRPAEPQREAEKKEISPQERALAEEIIESERRKKEAVSTYEKAVRGMAPEIESATRDYFSSMRARAELNKKEMQRLMEIIDMAKKYKIFSVRTKLGKYLLKDLEASVKAGVHDKYRHAFEALVDAIEKKKKELGAPVTAYEGLRRMEMPEEKPLVIHGGVAFHRHAVDAISRLLEAARITGHIDTGILVDMRRELSDPIAARIWKDAVHEELKGAVGKGSTGNIEVFLRIPRGAEEEIVGELARRLNNILAAKKEIDKNRAMQELVKEYAKIMAARAIVKRR